MILGGGPHCLVSTLDIRSEMLKENRHHQNRHHVPVQTTKAMLSPNWWSITKTVGEIKNLGVSFTSDGRQNSELDIRIGKASAVMRQLYRFVVLKRELCTKAKLSIFRSVYVLILTYGHECWSVGS